MALMITQAQWEILFVGGLIGGGFLGVWLANRRRK